MDNASTHGTAKLPRQRTLTKRRLDGLRFDLLRHTELNVPCHTRGQARSRSDGGGSSRPSTCGIRLCGSVLGRRVVAS
eukprot:scaffold63_cov306-Pinguiococcus_pyrenoidosus.AAC.14